MNLMFYVKILKKWIITEIHTCKVSNWHRKTLFIQITPTPIPHRDSFPPPNNDERRIISLGFWASYCRRSRPPVVFIPVYVFPPFWNLTNKNSSHYFCKMPFSYEVCISISMSPWKKMFFLNQITKLLYNSVTMSTKITPNLILLYTIQLR